MGILALRSRSLRDIKAAIEKGGWTHTTSSQRVHVGDKVIVFANKETCRDACVGYESQKVLVGTLAKPPYRLKEDDKSWPSSVMRPDAKYRVRYELINMELVPFNNFPQIIKFLPKGHLGGGFYLR